MSSDSPHNHNDSPHNHNDGSVMSLDAGPPAHWIVILADDSQVDVWADSVTGLSGPEDERDYEFGVLMDVEPRLQGQFDVTARTPTNPNRVEVCVARFPRSAVKDVSSAPGPFASTERS